MKNNRYFGLKMFFFRMKIRLFIITASEHLMNLDDILVKTEIKQIICFIYFDGGFIDSHTIL